MLFLSVVLVSFTRYVIKHTHLFFSFQIKRDDVFNNCKVVYTKPLSINTFQNVYNAFSLLIGTVHPAFHLLPTLVCYMFLSSVSYQTWHHLQTSKNKFITFYVNFWSNRPSYIRFVPCLYEFMYQHISSLKSTADPFNTSLWSIVRLAVNIIVRYQVHSFAKNVFWSSLLWSLTYLTPIAKNTTNTCPQWETSARPINLSIISAL